MACFHLFRCLPMGMFTLQKDLTKWTLRLWTSKALCTYSLTRHVAEEEDRCGPVRMHMGTDLCDGSHVTSHNAFNSCFNCSFESLTMSGVRKQTDVAKFLPCSVYHYHSSKLHESAKSTPPRARKALSFCCDKH